MVEWNNSDAEFDLQLVNPQGHYYTWSHTLDKNPEFIKEEKIRGFSSKQFYMGSTPPGQWQVNIKYHGNKSFDDTYLKVTAYTNYGSQIQTHRTEVYKLVHEKCESGVDENSYTNSDGVDLKLSFKPVVPPN